VLRNDVEVRPETREVDLQALKKASGIVVFVLGLLSKISGTVMP
jgi:hypothetical protein